MRLTWWQSNGHRRPQSSSRSDARRGFSQRLKSTLRLELLEDRTLLSDGVLDSTFGAAGLVTSNLSYSYNSSTFPANFPAAKFPTTATHQNSLAIQTISG